MEEVFLVLFGYFPSSGRLDRAPILKELRDDVMGKTTLEKN